MNEEVRDMYNRKKTEYKGDIGFDVYCPERMVIKAEEGFKSINLGIRCWSPDEKGYQLVPRSSITNYNLTLGNSIGIIDAGYTGYIIAKVRYNMDNYSDYGIIGVFMMSIAIGLSHYNEIQAILAVVLGLYGIYNFGYYLKNTQTYISIPQGTRLFQLVAFDGSPFDIEFVDQLPQITDRGDKGFGSTDLNSESIEKNDSASQHCTDDENDECLVCDDQMINDDGSLKNN
jgi:dUTPase